MRMRSILIAAVVLVAPANSRDSLAEQAEVGHRQWSFQIAERRQLSGTQIIQALAGNTMRYWRYTGSFRPQNWEQVGFVRPDGSFLAYCQFEKSPGGAKEPCLGGGYSLGAGWQNGIWAVENDQFCLRALASLNSKKRCYRVYYEGGTKYYFDQTSGPKSMLDGEVEIRQGRQLPIRYTSRSKIRGGVALAELSRKTGVRLPAHAKLSAPSASTSKYRSFLGVWLGSWSNSYRQKTILIVESIEGNTAKVIFAWGKAKGGGLWRGWQSGWRRTTGEFKGEYLIVRRASIESIAEYKITKDGELEHRYERRKPRLAVLTATMRKVPLK